MGRVDAQPSAGLEAERAVLGAMLIDESIVSQVLAEVDERDFTSTANRLIFQAAREVFREGGHADAITINAKLGYVCIFACAHRSCVSDLHGHKT